MKKLLLVATLSIACCLSLSAQMKNAAPSSEKSSYASEGTYQFICHPCKFKYVFSRETLIEIENKRDPEKDLIIHWNPCVDVLILSRKKIQSADFTPLDEIKEVSD